MKGHFGAYWPGESLLHKGHPGGKLLAFLILGTGVILAHDFSALVVVTMLLLFLGKACTLPLSEMFRGLPALLWMIALVLLAKLFSHGRDFVYQAGLVCARMCVFLVCANLFTLSTSVLQIQQAMRRILGGEPGFMAMLALRFLPVLDEERVRITRAQAMRGAPVLSRNPLKRVGALASVLVPLFAVAFKKAEQVALSMTVRGFSPSGKMAYYKSGGWRLSDLWVVISALLLAAILFLTRRDFFPGF